jgi:MbtH protein
MRREHIMNAPSDESFRVVVNDEEQYSVWSADLAVPLGWEPVGFEGKRTDCLAHIGSIWTDMRPRSLRGNASAA